MRRALAIAASLALGLTFQLAPFQHVHAGSQPVVHAHFYASHSTSASRAVETHSAGTHIEADDDGEHVRAWSLDTFTLTLPAAPVLTLPSREPLPVLVPPVSSILVNAIEERAHDPPAARPSSPRAPPL